jgi:hypothetical protein
MLSPTNNVMEEYHTLLVKMTLDSSIETKATTNHKLLVDVEAMLSLF